MVKLPECLQAHGALPAPPHPWLNLARLHCEPMKTLTSILLVACLAVLPMEAKAQSKPPPSPEKSRVVGGIVLGILVIAVGTIIYTGIKKMIDRIPAPSTNAPPEEISFSYPDAEKTVCLLSADVTMMGHGNAYPSCHLRYSTQVRIRRMV
jgi:hypothetical protein